MTISAAALRTVYWCWDGQEHDWVDIHALGGPISLIGDAGWGEWSVVFRSYRVTTTVARDPVRGCLSELWGCSVMARDRYHRPDEWPHGKQYFSARHPAHFVHRGQATRVPTQKACQEEGNFEKKQEKSNRKKKVHRIIGSFFSPLPDVLMFMTDFLQGAALNHCGWCGIEDNRCGRHEVDL